MNIQRLSTASGPGYGAAGPVQRKGEADVAQLGRGEDKGAPPQAKRLEAYAQKIDTRIQNAIDSGKLSERQVNALGDAALEFHALMGRIGNGSFGLDGPKRHFLSALSALTAKVSTILHQGEDSKPARPERVDTSSPQSVNVPPPTSASKTKIDTLA